MIGSARTQDELDSLVYPIVWLSRHAIEVALKGLIVAFHTELGATETFKANHNLVALGGTAEGLLRKLGLTDKTQLARLRDSIGRIASLDPKGTRFRYPSPPDETPSTATEAINLDVLAEEVKDILDQISAERRLVEDVGEDRRELAYHEAYEAWLAGLPDEVRDEYIDEEDYLWHRWMESD